MYPETFVDGLNESGPFADADPNGTLLLLGRYRLLKEGLPFRIRSLAEYLVDDAAKLRPPLFHLEPWKLGSVE